MSRICLLQSAENDLQNAYNYYESQSEERAILFLKQSEQTFALLDRFPYLGSRYHRSFRRILIEQFTDAVFYSIENRGLIVHAILGSRLHPQKILDRLNLP